jgi:uncharacterized phage protein (TIGR01671 family)
MSREIKFRAWSPDNKRMFLVEQLRFYGDELAAFEFADDLYNARDIVMQYTGLKDKNGTEIYEGDILGSDDGEWQDNDETWLQYIAGIVTWWDNNGRFHLSDDLEGYMGDDDYADVPMEWVKYEVIGNIHENPELLKGKS